MTHRYRYSLSTRQRVAIAIIMMAGMIMACAAPMALPIAHGPRWACPSPIPAPWGVAGPIKAEHVVATADPTTGVAEEVETTYYAEWEQEYGTGGTLLEGLPAYTGPIFPSPTAYGRTGNTFMLGQRVELAPLHIVVEAHAAEIAPDRQQVYLIDLTITNPLTTEVAFTSLTQVWLRTITRADGTQQTSDGWGVSSAEAARRGLTLPDHVPPGESRFRLPVLAPAGAPQVVELRMPIEVANSTEAAGIPTPVPNAGLRNAQPRVLTVQWVRGQAAGPPCDSPGALTDWVLDDQPKAMPRDAMLGLRAPPGAPRVVALALAQVGKRYVWGSTGPDTFDCSGLMQWSYAQIGMTIPRSTATQWPQMRPVRLSQLQPGDLVFFDTRDGIRTPTQITHVGMVADVDGDGTWDLVHAASPRLGVRVDYNLFASPYYGSRIMTEGRTAR